uniref:ADP-ribosylation factor-like protein 2-binding protein n=1 Tax=Nothobranchius kadleci TaxID=1051664 RepID=A0A1A8C465_NOTKA
MATWGKLNKMDVCELGDNSCGEEIDTGEEIIAVSSSSSAEKVFDSITGCLQDIIITEEFEHLETSFLEKHYLEFDDSDENKLSYTPIFNEYVNMLEKHLEQQLVAQIPDFNFNTFIELFMQNKEEGPLDIYTILLTFTEFTAFKEKILEYRAQWPCSVGLSVLSTYRCGAPLFKEKGHSDHLKRTKKKEGRVLDSSQDLVVKCLSAVSTQPPPSQSP